MERFTASIANYPETSFSGLAPYGKSSQNYEYYIQSFTNMDLYHFLVNLEGYICKRKIVLTKPPHSTPTCAMPNTYTCDTWTMYMINLNPYVSEV